MDFLNPPENMGIALLLGYGTLFLAFGASLYLAEYGTPIKL